MASDGSVVSAMADASQASACGSGTRGDAIPLLLLAWCPALWRAAASPGPGARVAIMPSRSLPSTGTARLGSAELFPEDTHLNPKEVSPL
jgi:hypothetical protein